jgi:putative intracellular protease/amidase
MNNLFQFTGNKTSAVAVTFMMEVVIPQGIAYVFVFDGFADWEPASALAELRRTFGFETRSIGLTGEPVTSMGGLRVIPDLPLLDFEPETAAILILPGGDSWMAVQHPEITYAVQAMESDHRPVAAICAATLALAHAGVLDDRMHTSNGADFIEKFVPAYLGASFYKAAPAITDRSVITASGLAPVAFAAEIFRALAPERADDIATYQSLYVRGFMD